MTTDMQARQAALDALATIKPEPTDLVEYVSRGRIVVLAPSEYRADVETAAAKLKQKPLLLFGDDWPVRTVRGFLGSFEITREDGETRAADVVADFYHPPLAMKFSPGLSVLPPGYFAAGESDAATILSEAENMQGTFHKPRYFAYDPSICAHGTSGVRGCERCIDACPARAVESAGDKVRVNPNLCQGCGLCTLTCPSGAMRYAYPPPADTLRALQNAITAYRQHDNGAPTVVFYAAESGHVIPEDAALIPAAVEEAGAAGMEIWLCALAFGAAGVVIFADNPQLAAQAKAQAKTVCDIIKSMGLPHTVTITEEPESIRPAQTSEIVSPARFAPDNDKRTMFFMALTHLAAAAENAPPTISLSAGAPFGEIIVSTEKCTLCMACAGACPVSAVRAGGDLPRLSFVEENCLQCGICEKACPEDAIQLRPRLLLRADERRQSRVLNEDKPFLCLQCNKPFAGSRMIARMEEKLKSHWMFKTEKERRRLRLCEDCRVRDMFDQ